jgi:hypothetical protein
MLGGEKEKWDARQVDGRKEGSSSVVLAVSWVSQEEGRKSPQETKLEVGEGKARERGALQKKARV